MTVHDFIFQDYRAVDPHEHVGGFEQDLLKDTVVAVVRDQEFLGLLGADDLIEHPHQLAVDCMRQRPRLAADLSVEEALGLMEEGRFHCLPVFEGSRFLGIVTYKSMVAHIFRERQRALSAYREVFNTARDAMFIQDANSGRLLDANPAAGKLTGYTRNELKGMLPSDLSIERFANNDAEYIHGWNPTRARGGSDEMFEFYLCRKDQTYVWVEVNLALGHIAEERQVVAVVRDITLRKRMDQYLGKIDRYDALNLVAVGLAHGLKSHLEEALDYLDMLQEKAELPPHIRDWLRKAMERASQAKGLALQLKEFSSDGVVGKTQCSLEQFIRENVTLFSHNPDVSMHYEFAADLLDVELERSQFARVIINLTINALQAMHGAQGQLTITARNYESDGVNGTSLPEGRYVEVRVQDTGGGIPAFLRERIFDPYFTTKTGAAGLGLAIVETIITQHGGHVSVVSQEGMGTVFTVLLPACKV